MEWFPIETAPKDGTRVLLYREGWGESMAVCWWDKSDDTWSVVGAFGTFLGATHYSIPHPPETK